MQFIFRTNANNKIGLGHLSRSISLMNLFNKIQCKIFVDQKNKIISSKFKNIIIKNLYNKKNKFIDELKDAEKFSKILSKNNQDYVFVDDYRIGYKWEKYVSKFCKKIICIDDFINRKHFSDVYINTKPDFFDLKNKNADLIFKNNKAKCKFLLGPKFFLPQSKLKSLKRVKKRKKFTLTFYNGGSGNILIYKNIIKKFIKVNLEEIQINIIVGTFSNNIFKVKKTFKKYKNIKIFYNPKNIYDVFFNTDLLISSAGVATYESAYLNIPSILIKMAKNQENSYLGFEKIGHYLILEKKDLLKTNQFVNLLLNILNNFNRVEKLTETKKINIKPNYRKIRDTITNE